jgi:bacterioferritin-associated ferredoxin
MWHTENASHNRYWPKGVTMYLCLCKGITESHVRDAGRAGIVMPCQIKAKFGLKDAGCCGRCAKNIGDFVELATSEHRLPCERTVRT